MAVSAKTKRQPPKKRNRSGAPVIEAYVPYVSTSPLSEAELNEVRRLIAGSYPISADAIQKFEIGADYLSLVVLNSVSLFYHLATAPSEEEIAFAAEEIASVSLTFSRSLENLLGEPIPEVERMRNTLPIGWHEKSDAKGKQKAKMFAKNQR